MEGLHSLSVRLASFTGSTITSNTGKRTKKASPASVSSGWPLDNSFAVNPDSLAAAGFYYQPSEEAQDNVVCFLCHKALGGWEENDQALGEHVSHSVKSGQAKKGCAFALLKSGGHKCRSLGLMDEKDLAKLRKETFGKKADKWWPHDGKRGMPSIADLVNAGFYLNASEPKSDQVTCAWCELTLDGWQKGDDPEEEHRRRNPQCAFFTGNYDSSPPSSTPARAADEVASMVAESEDVAPVSSSPAPVKSQPVKSKPKPKARVPSSTPQASETEPTSEQEADESDAVEENLPRSRSTRSTTTTRSIASSTSQATVKRATRTTSRAASTEPDRSAPSSVASGTLRVLPVSAPAVHNLSALLGDESVPHRATRSARTAASNAEDGTVEASSSRATRNPEEVVKTAKPKPAAKVPVKKGKKASSTPSVTTESIPGSPETVVQVMEEDDLDVPDMRLSNGFPDDAETAASQSSSSTSTSTRNPQPTRPQSAALVPPSIEESLPEIAEEEEEEFNDTTQPSRSLNGETDSQSATGRNPPLPLQDSVTIQVPSLRGIDMTSLSREERAMTLKAWHQMLIDEALKQTEKQLLEQLEAFDLRVSEGRSKLVNMLGVQ